MKTTLRITVLLVVALVANFNIASAAILRVNNNSGVTAIPNVLYTSLTSAYGAALVGDTLLMEGSNTSYGDFSVTKKLTIFGPGYLLAENPETQANLLTVTFGDLTFDAGSDGSTISGCKMNSVTINDNRITIARNYIQHATNSSNSILINEAVTGIKIQQNIIWGIIRNTDNKTIDVVIQNNLISAVIFTDDVIALIDHNTFSRENLPANTYSINVYNSNIYNNIVGYYYYYNHGAIYFDAAQGNTIRYNILEQSVPTPNSWTDNQYSVAWTTVYTSGTGAMDKNYKVTAGSPADNGDQDGKNCGMFGGSNKYVLSGLPPIPHIYLLDADPAGTNTDPLSVKISVKSQN